MNAVRYIITLILFSIVLEANAQETETPSKEVFVMQIRDQIDPVMSRYVELALEDARERQSDYVVIDMDTYGGAVNDADKIRTLVLDFEKPVFVYINKNAASAGALISIACDSIYMDGGANIGAATVVNGQDGQAMPDKYQSYMRSMMRSTAEENNRDPKIAEAMVDETLEVKGVSEEGKVLTFTTNEAIAHGFCEAEVDGINDIMERVGEESYQLHHFELGSTESIIAFFLSPMVSGFLILLILGGIYFEFQTPGVGFPLAAAIIGAIFYFVPYYMNGLAENWEIILFFVGVVLLGLEIFVIPGFGVAGVSGIVCMVAGLTLVMLGNDNFDFTFVDKESIAQALITTSSGFILAVVSIVIFASRLPQSKAFRRISLQTTLSKEEGYTADFHEENYIGMVAVAYTVLRPSGKIIVDDKVLDAYTRGSFIGKGEQVEVIAQTGTSLKVKKYTES